MGIEGSVNNYRTPESPKDLGWVNGMRMILVASLAGLSVVGDADTASAQDVLRDLAGASDQTTNEQVATVEKTGIPFKVETDNASFFKKQHDRPGEFTYFPGKPRTYSAHVRMPFSFGEEQKTGVFIFAVPGSARADLFPDDAVATGHVTVDPLRSREHAPMVSGNVHEELARIQDIPLAVSSDFSGLLDVDAAKTQPGDPVIRYFGGDEQYVAHIALSIDSDAAELSDKQIFVTPVPNTITAIPSPDGKTVTLKIPLLPGQDGWTRVR